VSEPAEADPAREQERAHPRDGEPASPALCEGEPRSTAPGEGEPCSTALGPGHILRVRVGHGANCSSIGSLVDTLFAIATVGGAVFASVVAAMGSEPVRVAGASRERRDPSDRGASGDPSDPRDGAESRAREPPEAP